MTLAAAGTDVVIFPAPRTENHRLFPSESFIGVGKEAVSLLSPLQGPSSPYPMCPRCITLEHLCVHGYVGNQSVHLQTLHPPIRIREVRAVLES